MENVDIFESNYTNKKNNFLIVTIMMAILLIFSILFFNKILIASFFCFCLFNILSEINSRKIKRIIIYHNKKEVHIEFSNLRKKWTSIFETKKLKVNRKKELFGKSGISNYLKITHKNDDSFFITQNDFSIEALDKIYSFLTSSENSDANNN